MKNMKYNVILSNYAKDSIKSSIDYYKTISNKYSDRILNSVQKCIERISEFPMIYRTFDTNPIYRQAVILKKFVLIYTINNDSIIIHYFLEGTNDFAPLIK